MKKIILLISFLLAVSCTSSIKSESDKCKCTPECCCSEEKSCINKYEEIPTTNKEIL